MASRASPGPKIGFAALGASITVPRGDPPDQGSASGTWNNWTQQLIRYRSFNFGPMQESGFPQFMIYVDDDDPKGITLLGAAKQIAPFIKSDEVSIVYLENSLPFVYKYNDIYNDTLDISHLGEGFCTEISQAIDTLSSSGAKLVVLGNIANFDVSPYVRDNWTGSPIFPQHLPNFPDPSKRKLFTDALSDINEQLLQKVAIPKRIPLIDLFGWSELGRAEHKPVFLGGCTLRTHYYYCSQKPTSLVVKQGLELDFFIDWQHPGPLAQALVANMFIKVVNWYEEKEGVNQPIELFSDAEILNNYGVKPLDPNASFDIDQFVILPS